MNAKMNAGLNWGLGMAIVLLMATALEAEPIRYRGHDAELGIRLAGEHSLRITIRPLDGESGGGELPTSPALVDRAWPKPVLQLRSIDAEVQSKIGEFQMAVRANPLTVRISDSAGQLIQEISMDEKTGALSFPCGEIPILGLGEGGKQFDRRGEFYPMRNGQVQGLARMAPASRCRC